MNQWKWRSKWLIKSRQIDLNIVEIDRLRGELNSKEEAIETLEIEKEQQERKITEQNEKINDVEQKVNSEVILEWITERWSRKVIKWGIVF